jgi:hypothetical protein
MSVHWEMTKNSCKTRFNSAQVQLKSAEGKDLRLMNSARGRRARCAPVAPGCLSPGMAQASVTGRRNDPTCTASIAGGAHDVLYRTNQHDSIQAIAQTTSACCTAL